MSVKAARALEYIDAKSDELIDIANKIWEYAELALHEHKSAALLVKALRSEGFEVETGVAEIPTAFVGTWSSGSKTPVIGFLGEYDASVACRKKQYRSRRSWNPGGQAMAVVTTCSEPGPLVPPSASRPNSRRVVCREPSSISAVPQRRT